MIKFNIHGIPWRIEVLEDDEYVKRFEQLDAGVTLPGLRRIYISESELDLETIRHEIAHAFYHMAGVQSANIQPHDIEEIFADIIAIHGPNILKLSRNLFKELS